MHHWLRRQRGGGQLGPSFGCTQLKNSTGAAHFSSIYPLCVVSHCTGFPHMARQDACTSFQHRGRFHWESIYWASDGIMLSSTPLDTAIRAGKPRASVGGLCSKAQVLRSVVGGGHQWHQPVPVCPAAPATARLHPGPPKTSGMTVSSRYWAWSPLFYDTQKGPVWGRHRRVWLLLLQRPVICTPTPNIPFHRTSARHPLEKGGVHSGVTGP